MSLYLLSLFKTDGASFRMMIPKFCVSLLIIDDIASQSLRRVETTLE